MRSHRKLKFNPSKVEDKNFNTEFLLDSKYGDRIRNSANLSDVIEINYVQKLENRNESLVSFVSDVVIGDDFIFICDHMQKTVLRFTLNGQFHGEIGRHGQGPGEYGLPAKLYLWDDFLAIKDSARAQILIFDQNGNYLRTFRPYSLGINLPNAFILHGNRLYINGFSAGEGSIPRNVILDIDSGGNLSFRWGFGKRYAPLYNGKRPLQSFSHPAFNKVGDTIWSGPPCDTAINVFDLDGRFLKQLPSGIQGMTYEDIRNPADKQKTRALRAQKRFNYKIFPFENLVFVFYLGSREQPSCMNIYSFQGDLLAKGLKLDMGIFSMFVGSNPGLLVSQLPLGDFSEEEQFEIFKGKEKQFTAFLEGGFDPSNFKDDNPYLIFYKLVEDGPN